MQCVATCFLNVVPCKVIDWLALHCWSNLCIKIQVLGDQCLCLSTANSEIYEVILVYILHVQYSFSIKKLSLKNKNVYYIIYTIFTLLHILTQMHLSMCIFIIKDMLSPTNLKTYITSTIRDRIVCQFHYYIYIFTHISLHIYIFTLLFHW